MNLLIVDDHPVNRKLLRMQLESAGCRVLEAAQGIEALEILDRESVEGVVSDILMPGMDGFQLCLEIRKRRNLARLPFVFYTGTFKSPQDREFARSVGADQYLTKPSTVREIIGALEHAMQTTRDRIAVSAARHDETYVLKQYNESLVRKLEEQKHELEGQNLELGEVLKNLKIAHASKQESEQRFRAIFDNAGVGISMRPAHDRKLPWTQVNDHFCKLLGYTRDELLRLSTAVITPADGQAIAVSDNQRLLSDDVAGYTREKQLIRKDGRRIWVLLTVALLPGTDGRQANIISTYQDITERKEAEEKVSRLNRVYAVLSGINTLIVHVTERKELFNGACRIAIEHGNFGMAWIGMLDPATQDVIPVAWAGEGAEAYGNSKSSAREDSPRGKGPVGQSIRGGRPVVSNSLTDVARPRVAEMVRLGFRSQITLPLLEGQTIVGTLTMYAREPNFFDEDEVRLLAELAGDISFAIENISRQNKFDKLSRIRAISSSTNYAIVHIRERQALLEEACRIAVDHGGFGIAWIGKYDPATLDVTAVAWAGVGPEQFTRKSTVRPDVTEGQGAMGRAIRERKPVFINDLSLNPAVGGQRREEAIRRGYRSLIALPLFVGREVFGNLTMFTREQNFFNDEEVALLEELAGNISFALEAIEGKEKIERLSRIRAMTSAINAAIVHARNRQELFEEVCRIAVERGRLGSVWIGSLNQATLDITPVAWAGEGSEEMRTAVSTARDEPPRGQGAVSRAVRERRAILNNALSLQSFGGPRRDAVLALGFRSMIALPLFESSNVIATFTLYAKESGFFDEAEVALLTELAGNVSFALDQLARQQKLDKLSRIRSISSEINAAIVRVRNRKALLKETCRIVSNQGGIELVWIGTIDQGKQAIEPVAWTGFSEEIAHRVNWKSINAAQGTLREAIGTRKAAVRNNIESEIPVGGMRGEALKRGCLSTVSLPLVVNGEVVALACLFAAGIGYFDKDELALLDEVASNISFALEHIEREEKFARLSRIEAIMGSINGLIVRTRDRDELFREACRIAVDEGRFRMSLIGIVDPSTMKVVPVATAGKDEGLLTSIKNILSSSEDAPKTMIARAIREKKAVVSNDSQSDPGVIFGKQYGESGVRSMVVLPLTVADDAVGVLALYSDETGFFDDEEMKLLTELTGNIAFAIDHIAKQERLDYLAYYDTLTGLANRTLFLERVAQSIQSAASGGHKLALFLIDLDRFKNINDSLGRAGGDALLRQVAAWMTQNLGDANLLARVDADHFAVVLPEVKQEGDVARLIEKSLGAFMAHSFQLRDAVFRIAAKVGVALFPDDGADADTLFRNAEAALKKAKSSGERYLFHTKKMTEAVAAKLGLENQLREALDKEEFVLHYQPKVDLASGAVCGLEALIRWQKPGAGLVAPATFIPLLEETGLILGVGKWALSKALSQHREWTARGIAAPRIAVNVSAIQLQQKDFSDVVTGALQAQGGEPDALELEVTESLLMQDVQDSIRTLSILRALGIYIAMDDFGTGYSSLAYLARLPINSLKIDRSFITEMANSPQDMGIVTTIVALAHSMNLKVVAEGVETEAQSKLLKLLKCDEAQGYLFSKPLPAAEIELLLRGLAAETRELEPVG